MSYVSADDLHPGDTIAILTIKQPPPGENGERTERRSTIPLGWPHRVVSVDRPYVFCNVLAGPLDTQTQGGVLYDEREVHFKRLSRAYWEPLLRFNAQFVARKDQIQAILQGIASQGDAYACPPPESPPSDSNDSGGSPVNLR